MTNVVRTTGGIKVLQTDAADVAAEFSREMRRPRLKEPLTNFLKGLVNNIEVQGVGIVIEEKGILILTVDVFIDFKKLGALSYQTTDLLIDAFQPVQDAYTGQTWVQLAFWNTLGGEIRAVMESFIQSFAHAVKIACLAKT